MAAEAKSDKATRSFKNRCANTRVTIDDKHYRLFSLIVDHPKDISEDVWRPMVMQDGSTILVDVATMDMLTGVTCHWLFDSEDTQKEPTIVAVEIGYTAVNV